MLDLVFAGILSAGLGSSGIPCAEDTDSPEYHLSDVCDPLLDGAPAYSATFRASLSPQPASQQVMVYRLDGEWFIRIAGYRWERGGEVVTRRHDIAVSTADVDVLVSRLSKSSIEHLGAQPYYGSENVICTDGANLELAMSLEGRKFLAAQHSCAGKTGINEITAIFRQLALRYDPAFDGLLAGLKD